MVIEPFKMHSSVISLHEWGIKSPQQEHLQKKIQNKTKRQKPVQNKTNKKPHHTKNPNKQTKHSEKQ